MDGASLRYGGGAVDLRKQFIRVCARLQRKSVLIVAHNPKLCARILASSETKGSFVEHLFAIPAWKPIYSIESEDGPRWQELATYCAEVLRGLRWRESMAAQVAAQVQGLGARVVDAEQVSRITVRVLYGMLFDKQLSNADEDLFYQASIEWRKQIAMKGAGSGEIKALFMRRFHQLIKESKFAEGLNRCSDNPAVWLSVFAQPFIISPQINVSDIMAAVFGFLRQDAGLYEDTRRQALAGNDSFLNAVIMETMRLRHPFPVLERELTRELEIDGKMVKAGTQVLIPLDQFEQDQVFRPQSWLQPGERHPFEGLVYGAGQRICLGKMLAKSLLVEMLRCLLIQVPAERLDPERGHLYSGRDNDQNTSFAEFFYQVRRFSNALWSSALIGLKSKMATR